LQSLDGANIQSMMGSEMAVNQLLALLDGALEKVTLLEKEIDVCDAILAKITVSETEAALRKMKSGKGTGPDDLPADLWKSKGWCPADWLTEFFNQVVAEKKVPESWQQSTTIPTWKKKGSPANCASYRPIPLPSHTMKISERIVDGRIRGIVQLSSNQCSFVAGCGTIDAVHAPASC
uniref:ERVV2 protein n=1 Tax=Heligmosomoides polygyrus TaxID=6339 RepID=A0A8L8KWU0_HELPZ